MAEESKPCVVKVESGSDGFLMVIGMVLIGSILAGIATDLKRIANALERAHPPVATIQRLPAEK